MTRPQYTWSQIRCGWHPITRHHPVHKVLWQYQLEYELAKNWKHSCDPVISAQKLLTRTQSLPINLQNLPCCNLLVDYPIPSNYVMSTPLEAIQQYAKQEWGNKGNYLEWWNMKLYIPSATNLFIVPIITKEWGYPKYG